jgi:hypothetical protein
VHPNVSVTSSDESTPPPNETALEDPEDKNDPDDAFFPPFEDAAEEERRKDVLPTPLLLLEEEDTKAAPPKSNAVAPIINPRDGKESYRLFPVFLFFSTTSKVCFVRVPSSKLGSNGDCSSKTDMMTTIEDFEPRQQREKKIENPRISFLSRVKALFVKENIQLLSACDSLNQKVLSKSLSVQTRVFRVRVLRVFRSTLRSARVCGRKSASRSSFGKDSKIFCDETLTTTRVNFSSRRKQKRRRKKEGRIKTDVYTFSISLSFARSRNQRPRTCLF